MPHMPLDQAPSKLWNSGNGSPEGVVTANVGSIYLRLDGGPASTLYIKESGTGNTGWTAAGSVVSNDSVTFAMLQNIATDSLIGRDTAGTGDPEVISVGGGLEFTGSAGIQRSALTGDVTASAGSNTTVIPNDTVTYAKLQNVSATDRLLGRDTAAAGDVEELTVGGGLEFTGSGGIQRSALTGDVTASAGSNATTIANDAVTLAKMANIATARFIGRTTSGTGDPEALTATQATAMLNLATTSVKGLAPVLSNDTTQFLRGDGSYAAPKQRMWLRFGGAVMTAGNTDRYPNPVGLSTSPIGATGIGYEIPVTGNLVATRYRVTTAHTTNTVTVTPRVNGVEQTTQTQTINATVATQYTIHATPLAVTAGDYIACQMDHNGATNLANIDVAFEFEF